MDPTPWQVPVQGKKLLVPSYFWRGQYSPLFLGVHVTSCVLLVLKLAVTATIGLNRDSTKLSKTAGSGLFKVPEEDDSFTIMKCPRDLLFSREDENLRKLTERMINQIIFRGHP
jgi:hypothetical protein